MKKSIQIKALTTVCMVQILACIVMTPINSKAAEVTKEASEVTRAATEVTQAATEVTQDATEVTQAATVAGDKVEVLFSSVDATGSSINDSMEFNYQDAYFEQSAYEYNQELALLSLGLAMSAGGASVSDIFNQYEFETADNLRSANVKATLENLGFTELAFYHYEVSLADTSDKVAFAIGKKDITINGEETTLIAVALRGSNYGNEWASNFKVGNEAYHEGFTNAAEDVKLTVDEYVNTLQSSGSIKGQPKVWLTGYSRSAAVANITAAKLIDDTKYTASNIYAYTFATPNTVENIETAKKEQYSNIFNLINTADLVPAVPFSAWGYARYGTDLCLPLLIQDKGFALLNGWSGNGSAVASISNLVDMLLLLAPNAQSYVATLQQTFMDNMSDLQGGTSSEPANLTDALTNSFGSSGTGMAANQMMSSIDFETIALGHSPEVFLNYLTTSDSESMYEYYSYKRVILEGNADIIVNGSDGQPLIEIVGGEIMTQHLPAYEYAGRWYLYLYGDSEFTYTITGIGTLKLSVEEYEKCAERIRIINYDNLNLDLSTYSGIILYGSMTDAKEYELSLADDTTITPDLDTGRITSTEYRDVAISSGMANSGATNSGEVTTPTVTGDSAEAGSGNASETADEIVNDESTDTTSDSNASSNIKWIIIVFAACIIIVFAVVIVAKKRKRIK